MKTVVFHYGIELEVSPDKAEALEACNLIYRCIDCDNVISQKETYHLASRASLDDIREFVIPGFERPSLDRKR